MKALILAAGTGSRLAPITDTIPKPLVQVNGKPILFKQIENLYENGITDITIMAGYKAEILKKEVSDKWPEINVLISEDYAITNNMYSAYLGIKSTGKCQLLMMNADVFCDSSVIKALLEFEQANAIVTDIGSYKEESMKVVEKNGKIVEISKKIKEVPLGNSIDLYKFDENGVEAFYNKCCEYIEEKKELKKWSEVALNDILNEVKFVACPLVGRWVEIDTFDDLSMAERIFKD